MLCPRCGDEGRLYIDGVLVTVQVLKDGAEQVGDLEWYDHYQAHCSCGWTGTVGELDETRQQIAKVTTEAEEAFWAVVAKGFPTARAGDMSPFTAMASRTAMQNAVREWVSNNVPEEGTPEGACPKDPDGQHFIGCGCE